MGAIFLKLLNMSLTASWLMLAVIILRFLLKKAPKRIICLLWALAAVRLVCPFSIESALSLIPSNEPLSARVLSGPSFRINTGVQIVDAPINNYLGDHYFEGVTTPTDNGANVMSILGIVWISGTILLFAYSMAGYYKLYRRTRASIPLEPLPLSPSAMTDGHAAMRYNNILLCDAIDTPFILGIMKPRIYLPSSGSLCWEDGAQTEYVITHENAHILRHDHWWKPIGFLILCVHWFNPLVWLSYILLCRDIELACDEYVISKLGTERKKPYAEALLACSIKPRIITACPLAFGEIGVKIRIRNVLNYKKPAFWIVLVSAAVCVIVAVCFLTSPAGEETQLPGESVEILGEEASETPTHNSTSDAEIADEEILLQTLQAWTYAFARRDGKAIVGMMSPELVESSGLGTGADFGFSSPWPWDGDTNYLLHRYDASSAEIYYYAYTSDPHVTYWKENLSYEWDGEKYIITADEMTYYDHISSGAEFMEAYPGIDGTMIDYTTNGLGDTLNRNAQLSSTTAYQALFLPINAAAFLLNLSDDPDEVQITFHEDSPDDMAPQPGVGMAGLDITFPRDQVTITISVIQPYGEHGIWVPVDYRVDVLSRFMRVDWDGVQKLTFSGDIPDMTGILCIGEIPEKNIKVYGYNDEDISGQGVAVEIDGDVNYFDWYYMTPRALYPDLYWDEDSRQLQIVMHIYTGTGLAADCLHVLQYYDTGTLQPSTFDMETYSALLTQRIDYTFHNSDDKGELILIDTKTREELAKVEIPEGTVTGLELGSISEFVPGETILFRVTPGYLLDGGVVAQYEDMPTLEFEVALVPAENGEFTFTLSD